MKHTANRDMQKGIEDANPVTIRSCNKLVIHN